MCLLCTAYNSDSRFCSRFVQRTKPETLWVEVEDWVGMKWTSTGLGIKLYAAPVDSAVRVLYVIPLYVCMLSTYIHSHIHSPYVSNDEVYIHRRVYSCCF